MRWAPLLLLLPGAALAEPAATATVTSTEAPIRVDGSLDEPAWATAAPITDFLRYQPTAGGPPPGATEVRLLQDARHLYLGVRVSGADYPVRARVSAREDINADDQIGVYLDTFRDRRSGYIFYLNAIGVQQDFRRNGDRVTFSWDAVFRSEGRLTEDGYELEIAWPWRSLRYGRDRSEWGLILTRKIPHQGEKFSFPAVERGHPQWFAQAAALTGLQPAPRGTGLELLPQLTVVQAAARPAPDAPLDWTGWSKPLEAARPSLDLRLGLSPNLGLTATANPDFSQVEQDVTPIALNQRFAFFFNEQRPFFLDGAEYFQDEAEVLYTRSVVAPLGGLKVAGREGAWQLGALAAVDRAPAPSVHERGAPGFDAEDVDGALASTAVLRATRDVGVGGTVGLSAADKRLFRGGAAVADHELLSLDLDLPVGGRWTVAGTHLHSFTGPAGPGVLHGAETRLRVQRRSGVGTGLSASVVDRTAGLRKETGFLNQSALTTGSVTVDHTFEPGGAVSTARPWLSASALAERDGDGFRAVQLGHELVVDGVQTLRLSATGGDRVQDHARAAEWALQASFDGQAGRVLEADGSVAAGQELDFATLTPAATATVTAGLTLRPSAGLRVDLGGLASSFRPAGEPALAAGRARVRVQGQFSKTLGLRLIGEWTDGDRRDPALLSSALLTWLRHPGTAIHLGYTEITDLSGAPRASSRAVFAKASVLLRP